MTNYPYILVQSKYLPNTWLDIDFEDRKYIVDTRLIELPALVTIIETEKKYKTVINSLESTNIKIQTIFYKNYELEFRATESLNAAILSAAGKLLIQDEDGYSHDCVVESVTPEKQSDNGVIVYNYKIQIRDHVNDVDSINDFVTQSFITERFLTTQLVKLEMSHPVPIGGVGRFPTYYTIFLPEISRTEIEESTIKLGNGIVKPIKTIDFKQVTTRFYFTEAELEQFQKYITRCELVTLYNPVDALVYLADSVSYTLNDKTDLIGIYEVDLIIRTDNLCTYNYAF